MNEDDIINGILKAEGGFVDHPSDKGGPTNMGITLKTLADAWRRPVSVDELKALNESEAREIYRALYIHKPGFHLILHDPLRALLVDCGVLHGTHRTVKWLQNIVGVPEDGTVGPGTLTALSGANGDRIYLRICAKRARLFGSIISADKTQAVFAKGWLDHRLAAWLDLAAA